MSHNITMTCNKPVLLVGVGTFAAGAVGAFSGADGVSRACGVDWWPRPKALPAEVGYVALNPEPSDEFYFGKTEIEYAVAVRRSAGDLSRLLGDPDAVLVFFCKLGGDCGSFVPPMILRMLSVPPERARAVVSTPFPFEGALRNARAAEALDTLRSLVSELTHVSPKDVIEHLAKPIGMQHGYDAMETHLLDAVRDCLRREETTEP